jgi:hypothetical protein
MGLRLAQQARRDIPPLTVIDDHRHGLLVVFHHHASERWTALSAECHLLPNTEGQHRTVRPHLLQKPEPFNDSVVKRDQFRLGELVNVHVHDFLGLARTHPTPNENLQPHLDAGAQRTL